jgi:hypothetical protein
MKKEKMSPYFLAFSVLRFHDYMKLASDWLSNTHRILNFKAHDFGWIVEMWSGVVAFMQHHIPFEASKNEMVLHSFVDWTPQTKSTLVHYTYPLELKYNSQTVWRFEKRDFFHGDSYLNDIPQLPELPQNIDWSRCKMNGDRLVTDAHLKAAQFMIDRLKEGRRRFKYSRNQQTCLPIDRQ